MLPSVAFVAAGVFIIIMAFNIPEAVRSGFLGMPRRTELLVLGIFFIVGPQLYALGLANRMRRGVSETGRIKETGIQGRALVVSALETGTYINNSPQLDLVLDVEIPGMEGRRVELKSCVSVLRLRNVQPGSWILAWADAEEPDRLAFEFRPPEQSTGQS